MDPAENHGKFHRMPAHFGPSCGPRQFPVGKLADHRNSPKKLAAAVSFLTTPKALQRILPPNFVLRSEPVVTAEISYLTEIDWLAGRGYATFGIRFPATYEGSRDKVNGMFLSVLWENLADPIISGREELGFSKVYCDIADPRRSGAKLSIDCAWQGFRFFNMELEELQDAPPLLAADPENAGLLHWKYIPRTASPGQADVTYATLTPSANPLVTVEQRQTAKGRFEFRKTRWDDMPTQFQIVNALCDLELLEFRGASLTRSRGGKDLGDQRILV